MTNKILPQEPDDAVQKMIDITKECLNFASGEDESITRNDLVHFAVNEQDKGQAYAFYERAAHEFHERLDELKGNVNPILITELQRLQLQLREQAENNNERMLKIDGLVTKEE